MTDERSDIDEIEQDLRRDRRRLESTLDQLSDRLTPGNLFDEALHYAGGGLRNVGGTALDVIRAHPLPVALIVAGAGWLIFEASRRRGPSADY